MNPYMWRRRRRALKLWGPVVAILVASALIANGLWSWMVRSDSSDRAESVAEMGELETAERLSWKLLRAHPSDIERWVQFIDFHAALQDVDEAETLPNTPSRSSVDDGEVRKLLASVKDPKVATLASYWLETKTTTKKPVDAAAVIALADANPPARVANYLLARAADRDDDWTTAAKRFEREGLAFEDGRAFHLRHALRIWIKHEAWNEVRARVRDSRYAEVVDSRLRLTVAEHDRDWPRILRYCWAAGFVDVEPWPVALAILNAALWFLLATRLGRLGDGIAGRRSIYAIAFLLGILSIYPTLIVIIGEDMVGFTESGQPVPDAIFFIFGVGLREELCKLLLFLPLLPALKRRGSRIEAMTAGALVGLGFAAEENIGYFSELAPGVALARFLTANFMHMALTALIALSVYDASRGRSTPRDAFNVIFPLAIGIHGLYDFFLSSPQFAGWGIFSMAMLVIITQQFLRQLLIASSAMEQEGVLRLLVASLALLTGVSYIYATTLVGPGIALRLVGLGVVGVAVMIWVFVRELATT
jgi:RsiW-degrading membrane proteinase PrsW (M82 family)